LSASFAIVSSSEIGRVRLSLGARVCQSIQGLSDSKLRSAADICITKNICVGGISTWVKTKLAG
jgi:hypothetical protein